MARTGPEFEKMTMEKQKENPKFSFLFGGDFYGYYKYKLALEQQQCEWGSAPFPRGRCGLPRPAVPPRGRARPSAVLWAAVLSPPQAWVLGCAGCELRLGSAPAGRPCLAGGSWPCSACCRLRPPNLSVGLLSGVMCIWY